MATVPISGTSIRLMSGIPFNADYKNTRWFDNLNQQTSYFNSRNTVHSMTNASFQRIEGRHFIKVNKSIDDLWGTNYLTFLNKNKRFYAFVNDLEYINDGLTHVHFQIDVLQTWLFQMKFKPSYVVREHRPLWNKDGTPVINTIDEGLNYGTDYEITSIDRWLPYGDNVFVVVVAKEVMHELDGKEIKPTFNGVPQGLSFYVHPYNLKTGGVPKIEVNKEHGYGESDILTFLEGMFTQEDAVNNIVSIYITDNVGTPVSYNSSTDTMTFPAQFKGVAITDDNNVNVGTIYYQGQSFYPTMSKTYSNKYTGFKDVDESKLLMYPYAFTELTDFKGNMTSIKNEYVDGKKLTITSKGSLGTTNKTSYEVKDYLNQNLKDNNKDIVSLQNALINNSANDLPVLSDYLSAYLQGNRNSIENQRNSIMWNGVFNLLGGGGSGAGSIMQQNSAISKGNSLGTKMAGLGVAQAGADVIQGAGNVQLQLESINAKIKDVDNTPANLVKMGSNTYFEYGNEYSGLYIIKKQILPEYRKMLGDYFKMFGYKTNQVKVPNFHTRKNFNYIQTESCVITGNFNNVDLQELKNVFDNGITLWHTNDIGNYELSNGVI